MKTIREKIHNYKTKYKEGFTQTEIKELLKDYPDINMDKFNSALFGDTCMLKGKEIIRYHCDIEKALLCGIENRDPYSWEWD